MAYKAKAGLVKIDEPVPEEAKEEEEANLPPLHRCPHGYYVKAACPECNEWPAYKPVIRDHRAAGSLLTPMNDPLVQESVEPITPTSSVHPGDRVARKIRLHEVGVIRRIERKFTGSIIINQIWVDFWNSGNSIPYEPTDLVKLKVQ